MKSRRVVEKIFDILVLFVAVLVAVGGVAYLFYYGQPFLAVCTIAVVIMALPFILERIADILQ